MFCWTAAKSSATFFTSPTFFNGEPLPQGYIFEQGHQNASLARQGLSGEPHRSPTRCRQDHRVPRGRWTASSLRAPGCVNSCGRRTDTPISVSRVVPPCNRGVRMQCCPNGFRRPGLTSDTKCLMKIRIPIFTREPISSHITFLSKDRGFYRHRNIRNRRPNQQPAINPSLRMATTCVQRAVTPTS
jgi:hypothetical protein